jgi:hypothetical protein
MPGRGGMGIHTHDVGCTSISNPAYAPHGDHEIHPDRLPDRNGPIGRVGRYLLDPELFISLQIVTRFHYEELAHIIAVLHDVRRCQQ